MCGINFTTKNNYLDINFLSFGVLNIDRDLVADFKYFLKLGLGLFASIKYKTINFAFAKYIILQYWYCTYCYVDVIITCLQYLKIACECVKLI